MYHLFIFCLNAAAVFSQSSTFQCQPSSDLPGLVYTPNIADFYFDQVNVEGSNEVTTFGNSGVNYVFPVPRDRDCSGTVLAIEHCYMGLNRNQDSVQSIFTLYAMNQVGLNVTVSHTVHVESIPSVGNNCEKVSSDLYCCDIMQLSNSQQFQLPPTASLFAYGLEYQAGGDIQPLAFVNSSVDYSVIGYTGPLGFTSLNLVSGIHSGLPVMRLLVEVSETTTNTPVSTVPAATETTVPAATDTPVTTVPAAATTPVTAVSATATTPVTTVSATITPIATPVASPVATPVAPTTPPETTAAAPQTNVPVTSNSETATAEATTDTATESDMNATATTVIATKAMSETDANSVDAKATTEITASVPVGSADSDGATIGAGLAVSIIVLLVFLTTGALLVLFVCNRRRKQEQMTIRGNEFELFNPSYGECDAVNNVKSVDYAGVGPAVYTEVAKKGPHPEIIYEEGSHEYAETGAYEVPLINKLGTASSSKLTMMTSTFEKEDDIYMVPAQDVNSLYEQLRLLRTSRLERSSVKLSEHIGSGQFGLVYKGVLLRRDKNQVEVAVKTLKEGSDESDKVKFLQEAAIMGQFIHHNVVEMFGVVTEGEPVLLVLELLLKGDLLNYLKGKRSPQGTNSTTIDDHTLLSYCRQVASGMAYLSSKAFVHRDLAARNILVSDDDICKIADFGMSRDLVDESYYVSHGGMIPVKWTAPEALNYKKYSTASDVWSYGVLMYEIWSVGHKPFEGISNEMVIRKVDGGYRLPPPPGCPRELYRLMIMCWHADASQRPSFQDLARQLSLPDTKLLKWSEEDKSVHPEAAQLGADLLCGEELYKDLQTR